MPTPPMLALVTDAFGGLGGIAQYNRDFLSAVAEGASQHETPITVLPRQAPERTTPPKGIRQLAPSTGRLLYAIRALAIALTQRVELVFCGHLYMTPLAMLIARLKGAKLIVQAYGIEAWPRPSCVRRAALESADLIFCISRHTRVRVLEWADMAPERVMVLPSTVGDAFTPGEAPSLRAALGLEGKRVLLTVGRMDSRERYKGHDSVIRAIPQLIEQGHEVVYVIVGKGDDIARLKQLALQEDVSDRVRFLGNVKSHILVDVCRMADLFVMPSRGEGFGIAFLEAMASGTPALGLDIAGARDALAEGELGMIASEKHLAAAISDFLRNSKPDRRKLAAAVHARFGRHLFSGNVRRLIERLFSASSSSSASCRTPCC